MKLITELIEFALQHNMLTVEHKRKLQDDGFYKFYYEEDEDNCSPYSYDYNYDNRKDYEQDAYSPEDDELDRTYYGDFYHPGKRSGKSQRRKRKSPAVGPELTLEELNQRVEEDWKKLAEEFPRFQELWDSWKAGKLMGALADGFTLNDVYAMMKVELQDFHDFSGPAPTAYRQLLRQVGNIMGKYSWVIKNAETASMVEFHTFRRQILEDVMTLYDSDRKRFETLSSQNGKLNFPFWEKACHTDTTSMKVWTILNFSSKPVTTEIIEAIQTWKTELAIAMQMDLDYMTKLLAKLEERDWSSFMVITERVIKNNTLKFAIIPDDVKAIGVVIPEGVEAIGDKAFWCRNSVTSVAIPKGVKKIGSAAFWGCSSLTSAAIPESVEEIGEEAFRYCRCITSVTIPKGVKTIELAAFGSCSSLTSVVISEGVSVIGRMAFESCKSLTSVAIPESVKAIEGSAFSGCKSLTSVAIPDGVKEIGSGAFCGCESLTSVAIPESVTEIGSGAFCGCGSLTSAAIPDAVTTIEKSVFQSCCSLKSVAIPDAVTSIEECAFEGCCSLKSVTLPEDVQRIGNRAFRCCNNLFSVTIPEAVTAIGSDAFQNCPNLTIYASARSYAQKYANKNHILFRPIEEEV